MGEKRLLKVKVLPSSRESVVRPTGPDSFIVQVKSPPLENRANEECLKKLSEHLNCGLNALRILRGARSTHKIIEWKTGK